MGFRILAPSTPIGGDSGRTRLVYGVRDDAVHHRIRSAYGTARDAECEANTKETLHIVAAEGRCPVGRGV